MTPVRLLPCSSTKCSGLGAMLPPSKANPAGEPYLSMQRVDRYKCHRCGDLQQLSAQDWSRLPRLSVSDILDLAKSYRAPEVAERVTCDLEGYGLTKEQAADMLDSGMTLTDAIVLSREGSQSGTSVDTCAMLEPQAVVREEAAGSGHKDAAERGHPPEGGVLI